MNHLSVVVPLWATWAAFLCRAVGGKDFNSLRDEFQRKSQEHGTEFFQGSRQLLEQAYELSKPDLSQAVMPAIALGFAYINDRSYEECAQIWAVVAANMPEGTVSEGPHHLETYCLRMIEKPRSTLDAIASLRVAHDIVKKELAADKAELLMGRLREINSELHDPPPNVCNMYVPGLTARTFHDSEWFLASRTAEKNFEAVSSEVDAFVANSGDAEMSSVGVNTGNSDSSLVQKGTWRDISLYHSGIQNKNVCKTHFPRTCKMIEKAMPEVWTDNYGHVLISQLYPGSELKSHRGATNAQLTLHLALTVPKGKAGIKAGSDILEPGWQVGKATVFDDSYDHEVWHHGGADDVTRVVLLLRMWHPDLTLEERIALVRKNGFHMSQQEVDRRVEYLQSDKAKERWHKQRELFRARISSPVSSARPRSEL